MSIFDDIQPYFACPAMRERMHVKREEAACDEEERAIAAEEQAVRVRIHALKLRRLDLEQLKDKLAEEADRAWQQEAQLTAAAAE